MLKIYHNHKCGKSKAALAYLHKRNLSYDSVDYIRKPPTKDELLAILQMLNKSPLELLLKNERIYKENFEGKKLKDEEWIDIMIAKPSLLERPIVVYKNRAAIGRPM